MERYISKSTDQTLRLAQEFALTLKPGDIVLLDGDLGAGKTVFSKGVVLALSGGKIVATSPTFVTMNIYETNPRIYHFDLYRLGSAAELDGIGAEEYIFGDGISLIEWPGNVDGYFPQSAIRVFIKKVDDNTREITVER